MKARVARWSLSALVLAVGLATAHGAIRTPDSEVVFRVAVSLATHGSFAVDNDLEAWRGFGLPQGREGRRYAVFSPLLSVLEAPLYRAIEAIVPQRLPHDPTWVPPSFYFTNGYRTERGLPGLPLQSPHGHLVRSLMSVTEVSLFVVIALAAFELSLSLCHSVAFAWLSSVIFSLGTFLLSYITELFSEPLALALTLVGLTLSLRADPCLSPASTNRNPTPTLFLSGLLLGLSVTAHLSAILALPFITIYSARPTPQTPHSAIFTRATAFISGTAGPLLLLGLYNYLRFGSPLETGRGLQSHFGYGHFALSWRPFYGLLFSWGKGLLWYSPIALGALFFAPRALRAQPTLALAALTAWIARYVFISLRSDWHAGFCLGPRYLLLALPFSLVIAALAARNVPALFSTLRQKILALSLASVLIASQLYFATLDLMPSLRTAQIRQEIFARHGISLDPYFDFDSSPFAFAFSSSRGPWLYRLLGFDTPITFVTLTLLTLTAVALLGHRALSVPPATPSPPPLPPTETH